jgi:hypothetical protein
MLDDRGSRVRFPAGAGNFSLHHRVQNGSGAQPASCPMDTRGSFPGVRRPGREADHSPSSSAEVKYAWNYTPTPQYVFMARCLVKHRDIFTFLPLLPLTTMQGRDDVLLTETVAHRRPAVCSVSFFPAR